MTPAMRRAGVAAAHDKMVRRAGVAAAHEKMVRRAGVAAAHEKLVDQITQTSNRLFAVLAQWSSLLN